MKALLLSISLLLSSGVAVAEEPSMVDVAPVEMVKVTIKRPDIMKGGGYKIQYFIDGTPVGNEIGRGESTTILVPMGKTTQVFGATALDPRKKLNMIVVGTRKYSTPELHFEVTPTETHHMFEAVPKMLRTQYNVVF